MTEEEYKKLEAAVRFLFKNEEAWHRFKASPGQWLISWLSFCEAHIECAVSKEKKCEWKGRGDEYGEHLKHCQDASSETIDDEGEVPWIEPKQSRAKRCKQEPPADEDVGGTKLKKEEASQSGDVIMIFSSDEEEIRDVEERFWHLERERRRQARKIDKTMNATETKYCPTKFIPALKRAMKHTEVDYSHQKWAFREAKKSLIEAAKRGEAVTLGSLHRLPNIGIWVEQQICKYYHKAPSPTRSSSSHPASSSKEHSKPQPQPTPNFIDWQLELLRQSWAQNGA